jgi:hypothetical protein
MPRPSVTAKIASISFMVTTSSIDTHLDGPPFACRGLLSLRSNALLD